ncbi:hypothetical protein WN944_000837 [Citrus x changshan-huyou]|uniref:Uncharacterized protein n=1 Tax=Citrus x changshan-huyou TaxID=2935761 RepID=A0AAP0QQM6_9ROSI
MLTTFQHSRMQLNCLDYQAENWYHAALDYEATNLLQILARSSKMLQTQHNFKGFYRLSRVLPMPLRELFLAERLISEIFNWYQSQVKRSDPSMAALIIDLEKFNGNNDFNIWKVKIEALLITQGLGDAIEPATKKKEKRFLHHVLLSKLLKLIKRPKAR